MKIAIFFAVLCLFLSVGYFLVSPFLTLDGIKDGIAKKDAEILADNIDFPTLRQNLRDQMMTHFAGRTSRLTGPESVGSVVGTALAAKVVDGLLEAYVTPAGLQSLLYEGVSLSARNSTGRAVTGEEAEKIFHDARCRFDSLRKFSAYLANPRGGEIRLVLTRSGLSWKLTNIVFPQSPFFEPKQPSPDSPPVNEAVQEKPPERNLELAMAKRLINADPDLELISADEGAHSVTVKHKKTGRIVTLTIEKDPDGKVVIRQQEAGTGEHPQGQKAALSEVAGAVEKAKNNPKDFDAQMEVARRYYQIGRYAETVDYYKRAYAANPTELGKRGALSIIGQFYFDEKKYDESATWFSRAVEANPEDNVSGVFLAVIRKDTRGAEEALNKFKQINPKSKIIPAFQDLIADLNAGKPGDEAKTESSIAGSTLTPLFPLKDSHIGIGSRGAKADEAQPLVDSRPIPLNSPRPGYTEAARTDKVEGQIRARVLVGQDGGVSRVKLLSHLPDGLDEEAVAAAYKLRFRPAMKDGRGVAYWVTVDVGFTLH